MTSFCCCGGGQAQNVSAVGTEWGRKESMMLLPAQRSALPGPLHRVGGINKSGGLSNVTNRLPSITIKSHVFWQHGTMWNYSKHVVEMLRLRGLDLLGRHGWHSLNTSAVKASVWHSLDTSVNNGPWDVNDFNHSLFLIKAYPRVHFPQVRSLFMHSWHANVWELL